MGSSGASGLLPAHRPAPICRAGLGRESSSCWLGLQGLPCCESRPSSVRTRSTAVLTGTTSTSLGRSRNLSPSVPLSAQVFFPHAPRSLTCPTPAAPPLPTPSLRKLGTCWQVKSPEGKGGGQRYWGGGGGEGTASRWGQKHSASLPSLPTLPRSPGQWEQDWERGSGV